MTKLKKKQRLELGLEILLDKVPLNSGKVHELEFIQFNPETCNAVLRTDKGILKTHLMRPEMDRIDKRDKYNDFVNGVSQLATLANIFPESYTPVRDFKKIDVSGKENYLKLFPYNPEKILLTITDEIKGPCLDELAASEIVLDEKLRILMELGDIVHYSHKIGIINCDLKPSNVILKLGNDNKYHPVLFDAESFRYKGEGLTLVTPAYLPPKTARAYFREENNEILSTRSTEYMTAYEDLDNRAFLVSAYEFINREHPQKDIFADPSKTGILKTAKKRINVDKNAIFHEFFQNAFDGRYKNMKEITSKLNSLRNKLNPKRAA